jgi:uncharacterized phage-associated protein
MRMRATYNDRKCAQIGAYFLNKAGGVLPHMKLMKLMYLANRQYLSEYGESLTGDVMSSMNWGPILSQTLDLINGAAPSSKDGWTHWISDRAQHKVKLIREFKKRRELDELSDDEIDTLKAIWAKFGHLDQFELSKHCHDNCGEWVHPEGSSTPISHEDVLRATGWKKPAAKRAGESIEAHQALVRKLARL